MQAAEVVQVTLAAQAAMAAGALELLSAAMELLELQTAVVAAVELAGRALLTEETAALAWLSFHHQALPLRQLDHLP